MISYELACEVERLLAEGFTERAIHAKTGVSRGAIQRVRKRGAESYERPAPPRTRRHRDQLPAWRCPGCGGTIVTPTCVLCNLNGGAR